MFGSRDQILVHVNFEKKKTAEEQANQRIQHTKKNKTPSATYWCV